MARTGDGDIAVIGSHLAAAESALPEIARRLPRARLVATTLSRYLARRAAPPSVVLVAGGADRESDRRFLESARDRLLWKLPPAELYDAISGVLAALPPRSTRLRVRGGRPGPSAAPAPALLLEGRVDAARAREALSSPVRSWVVEHVGCVRLAPPALASLAERGVQWSVLAPVRLVGVHDPGGAARGLFSRGTRIWRSRRRERPASRRG